MLIVNYLNSEEPEGVPSFFILMGSNEKVDLRRRLCDLLEEQQEPFMLDIYLLEHSYSVKSWDFDKVESRCWSLQKPGKAQLKKRLSSQSAILPRILKLVVDKLVFPGKAHGAGSLDSKDNHAVRQFDGSSSSRTSTTCDQFVSSEAEESSSAKDSSVSSSSESMKPLQLPGVKDEHMFELVAGESKQLSPVSVLETSTSRTYPPNRYDTRDQPNLKRSNLKLLNRVAEESVFFWSMWETLINTIEEKHGFGESELQQMFLGQVSYSQSANTKLVLLHQSRQLLFDYVREVVESIIKKEKALSSWGAPPRRFQLYPGPEQLAKIICQQICSWSNTAGHITNTGQLVEEADFSRERNEWIQFKSEVYGVVSCIEAAILREIIDEIASDLIRISSPIYS